MLAGLFRPILRRARLAIVASEYLAAAARELGARDVRVVPSPVEIPESVGEPDDPPHVLFVGRLSPEKGIHEFLERDGGHAAGDRRRRTRAGARGGRLRPAGRSSARYYERAAVVCVPSRREGYGVVAREAMAYGRPVVATAVGGLVDAVRGWRHRRLVPPGDAAALREAIEGLLSDVQLRTHLGAAARGAAAELSSAGAAALMVRAYER